jgi:hypothetical protein
MEVKNLISFSTVKRVVYGKGEMPLKAESACSLPLWSLSLAIIIGVMLLFGLPLNAVVPETTMEESDAGTGLSEVYPTCKVMFFWGTARIEGLSVVPGDRIDAFAPDVVINDGCIGTFTVWYPGYYGALAVYGDDPTTPEKDGAAEGDPITFTITRTENGKTSVAYPVTSSNPTFRNFSFQRVDLCAD